MKISVARRKHIICQCDRSWLGSARSNNRLIIIGNDSNWLQRLYELWCQLRRCDRARRMGRYIFYVKLNWIYNGAVRSAAICRVQLSYCGRC